MPTQTSERWIADGNAVKAELEAQGYTVDLQYANDDIPTQTQQIDAMIQNGAKALIIASIDGTALSAQLQAAADKGIPVISYDRLIRDSQNVDFYVTFDNFAVGVAQANALTYGLGVTDKDGNVTGTEKGVKIELFAGSLDDNNAHFFFNGAMSKLQPLIDDGTLVVGSGRTKIEEVAILRWEQARAQQMMDDILTSTYGGTGEGLKGVLSPFDGASRGIITSLQAVMGPIGIDKGLPIITGQDAEIASVKLINDGIQQSTIFKDTRLLAKKAAEVAATYLSGGAPEPNNTSDYDNGVKVVPSFLYPVVTVYKDDIKAQLIDTGYWTQAQVDAGVA
jgi:putative multiple sugar transport system substrate-binding protein